MARGKFGAHLLRSRVRFQRQASGPNIGGEVKTEWEDVGSRAVRMEPSRGGEETLADRRSGVSTYDLQCRLDTLTREITPDYRAALDVLDGRIVDPPRIFTISWCEPDTRQRGVLNMFLIAGKGDVH